MHEVQIKSNHCNALCREATASATGARCLDGSPPGYYYRSSSSVQASTKWKLHIMGGGWCVSGADCLARSKTLLGTSCTWGAPHQRRRDGYFVCDSRFLFGRIGSSSTWPSWLSDMWPPEVCTGRRSGSILLLPQCVRSRGRATWESYHCAASQGAAFYGLMDANSSNPFGDWNFVWVGYCDGTCACVCVCVWEGAARHVERGRVIFHIQRCGSSSSEWHKSARCASVLCILPRWTVL